MTHGTLYCYRKGCRCDVCVVEYRRRNTEQQKKYRHRAPERQRAAVKAYEERHQQELKNKRQQAYRKLRDDPDRWAAHLSDVRAYKEKKRRERGAPKRPNYTPEERQEARRKAGYAYWQRNKAKHKAYYEANKKRIYERNQQWRKEHPDKWDAMQRKYRATEKGRAARRARVRIYESQVFGAAGSYSVEALKARWDFWGGKCYLCSKEADTVDHVKPVARGGSNWPANLRPACRSCNSRKNDKTLAEYEQMYGPVRHHL